MNRFRWARMGRLAGLCLLVGAASCRGARRAGGPAPRAGAGGGASMAPTASAAAGRPCPPEPLAPADLIPTSVVFDERVSPVVDCNPVRTQHTLVVTVLDQCGNPLAGQRVEWILARGPQAVGDIVAVDDQHSIGAIAPMTGVGYAATNAGNKVDNLYAVSSTNFEEETIDAANNYPYVDPTGARLPDIRIGRGQSWITITSVHEGVTDLVVYVPGIKDGSRHKIFAKKIWADFTVTFPPDATNLLPSSTHAFTVRVHRISDGAGLAGQPVEAEVLDGPDAAFDAAGSRTAVTTSGADGNATFVLRNVGNASGTNRVRFTARGRFYEQECPRSGMARKTWQRVALSCQCALGPCEVNVGETIEGVYTVQNTGDATAADVRLDLQVPQGLQVADGTAFPLSMGSLAAGESKQKTVRFVASAQGTFTTLMSATAAEGGASTQCGCTVNVVLGNLEVLKRCEPAQVSVGDGIRFVVMVQNTGRGTLKNVVLTDAYPDGITPGSQATVTVGDMLPGTSQTYEFQGTATRPGKFTNTVRANADGQPEKTSSCEVTVVQCALSLELICPGRIGFGEPGNFTVKVTNNGDGPANNCVVHVVHGACLSGGVLDVPVGFLAPGQTWTHDWTAAGAANAQCVVTAEVACSGCTDRKECQVEVTGLPAIQCEMTDKDLAQNEAGIFQVGDEFLYVLDVVNDVGTQATPPLKVVLSLPPELEFVSATGTRGVTITGAGKGATTNDFRLDVNEHLSLVYRVRVVATPPGNLVKTVAAILRASDGAELATETESTTVK